MSKLLWRIEYVWRLMLSPYDFSLREGWQESGGSWDCHTFFSPDCEAEFPSPSEALDLDHTDWADL